MLRRDLGFLVSRVMAVIGVYWLLDRLAQLLPLFQFVAEPYNRGSNSEMFRLIAIDAALCVVLVGVIWFLWWHAGKFGVEEDARTRSIHIDTSSLRATVVFGLGLYYLVGGLVNTLGLLTIARLPQQVAGPVSRGRGWESWFTRFWICCSAWL